MKICFVVVVPCNMVCVDQILSKFALDYNYVTALQMSLISLTFISILALPNQTYKLLTDTKLQIWLLKFCRGLSVI